MLNVLIYNWNINKNILISEFTSIKTFAIDLGLLYRSWILLGFSNKYGFVIVTNFLMICEKHSYLQLSIKLGIWRLVLNLNKCAVNTSTGMLLFISSY